MSDTEPDGIEPGKGNAAEPEPAPPARPSPDPELSHDEAVGEYRIVRRLGSGGFGTVYEALQPLIGRRVAVKVLARKYSADPDAVSRFVAEARVANQIGHRSIVGTFSFGQLQDGRHYHVMEFVDGETLEALLKRRGALPLDESLKILRDIAAALDAAHRAGVVHRDLKPANVLVVDEEGTPVAKVIDFGVAKLLDDEERAHKTRSGALVGTPLYMSPEQCRGRAVDAKTDVYSFGVLAYEMLTGAPPFDGDESLDLLLQHTSQPPVPPSQRLPDLPVELDAPLLSLLNKAPAERPGALGAVVEALGRARESSRAPSGAARAPGVPRADVPAAATSLAGAAGEARTRAPRPASRRWAWLLGAAALAAAAALGVNTKARVPSVPSPELSAPMPPTAPLVAVPARTTTARPAASDVPVAPSSAAPGPAATSETLAAPRPLTHRVRPSASARMPAPRGIDDPEDPFH